MKLEGKATLQGSVQLTCMSECVILWMVGPVHARYVAIQGQTQSCKRKGGAQSESHS